MHDSMVSVSLLPIAIKFISSKYRPMLLVSVRFGLQIALTLEHFILESVYFAETLKGFDLLPWTIISDGLPRIIFLIDDTFFRIHIYHGFI